MEALDRLANAAGIEPRYWDIEGRLHERTPETARHLLAAMGIAAGNDGEIAASLKAHAEAPWRSALPPVVIALEGRAIAVPFRAAEHAQSARWTLELESGERREGECAFADLPVEYREEIDGVRLALRHLHLPAAPAGYHRLQVNEFAAPLIAGYAECHLPPPGRRYWGISAQLYALRSARNWGMGDFSDLAALMEWTARKGGDAVGINPLHALFLDAPDYPSPYAPASRLFHNPLYLNVAAVPDFAESEKARALVRSGAVADAIAKARAAKTVDYASVASAKMAVLECLFAHFGKNHASDERGRSFRKFVDNAGPDLRHFATFQMLAEHFAGHDWRKW
ncbi:MAG TPA: 4-alpha-glucanotransferase, partial [Rhizomicrobium sp.]|nr:4-alpha-glucanotransferase [Rhizomicrobium sp.]